MSARVIVVGAGPAGCSAAIGLRRAGHQVVLVEKGRRGRDKVCGDALLPDAWAALEALGCLAPVRSVAHPLHELRIQVAGRPPVQLPGRLGCLPRAQLDAVLLAAAEGAGAEILAGMTCTGLLEHAGRVAGVHLQDARGTTLALRADHVLLATGAAAGPLEAAGMCLRRSPSGMALRTYFEVPAALAQELDALTLCYDRRIGTGYGWIFAGPGGVFNLGVGCFHDGARRPRSTNLRELWGWFLAACAPAAQIARYGRQLAAERGAPLRTSLCGARVARPGLLLAGEAIGTTYAFTGEGIGKALETGLLAAHCLASAPEHPGPLYEQELRARYRPRFEGWRIAQDWLSLPLVWDLLARQAHRSDHVRALLAALLADKGDPRELFSARGLLRLAFA